jgi:hypothetical protein
MANKKEETKIETDAPKKSTKESPEQQLEGGEEDIPTFQFPTEFYGNEWSTVVNNMIYWAKLVEGPFVYEANISEEDAWAVCSDDGVKEIVSAEDFNVRFTPYSTQASHEPFYLSAEAAE